MGRDIITAGVLGICAVIVVVYCHPWIERAASWPRRYVRARGYEFELARHTAAGIRAELEDYTTKVIDRAEVAGDPPWPELEPVDYDPSRYGLPLPDWAAPEADRVTLYGGNSGSSGSEYGLRAPRPGAWPVPADNGTGDTGHDSGRGSEACGLTAPAPTLTGDDLGPKTGSWVRLMDAWTDGTAAPSVTLEGTNAASAPESSPEGFAVLPAGRLAGDDQRAGPVCDPNPGAGDVIEPPSGSGAAPPAPAWESSRLGTRFDAELAAEVSAYIRAQDQEVTAYLAHLLGVLR